MSICSTQHNSVLHPGKIPGPISSGPLLSGGTGAGATHIWAAVVAWSVGSSTGIVVA